MIELLHSREGRDGSIVSMFRSRKRDLPRDGNDLRDAVHRHEHIERITASLRRARALELIGIQHLASVPGAGYVVNTGGSAVALTAATAKTIMYLNAGAADQPDITEICVAFDGVTAGNTPALVELMFGTKATNSTPGTASTAFTALQLRGWPAQASQSAGANVCTSEPTVLTSLKQWLVTPNGGLLVIQSPLGREPTGVVTGTAVSGNQIAVRVNAPQTVNCRGYLEYDE